MTDSTTTMGDFLDRQFPIVHFSIQFEQSIEPDDLELVEYSSQQHVSYSARCHIVGNELRFVTDTITIPVENNVDRVTVSRIRDIWNLIPYYQTESENGVIPEITPNPFPENKKDLVATIILDESSVPDLVSSSTTYRSNLERI